ncbi:MAG: alpha/beta hydrolase [Alphaproteobacteria bacterium]|nr:alpha/beta hydrolase [Alphaproteobacteria bacterium]
MTPDFLTLPDRRLAYQRRRGRANAPGIVFLGGFASDMTGTKASFLAGQCEKADLSFLRFDYRGHGQSSGDFKDGTIGAWSEDACMAVERLTEGPQILIGSSMGGWLALMLAAKMPERVHALIGIAAAPDFTEDLMWLRLSPEQRARLERDGLIYDETAPPDHRAPLTLNLIREARNHLMLRAKIPLACPARLLQGLHDEEVPWQHTLRIAENLTTDDVRITLVKDGDHRLSRPQDLQLLWQWVGEFVKLNPA